MTLKVDSEALWNSRKLAVVTLFAGRRHCLEPLMDWYANEEFPPNTHCVWIDDSGDPAFHLLLLGHSGLMQSRVASLRVLSNPEHEKNISDFVSMHDRVAAMYTRVIASMTAGVYLTVEDDVIAPVGSVRLMLGSGEQIPYGRWGGICAVYPSRFGENGGTMVASKSKDQWIDEPIDGFPADVVEMGCTGAGFAAWDGTALLKALPLQSSVAPDGYLHGWDGTLCRKLAEFGYKVGVDGRIHCRHLFG